MLTESPVQTKLKLIQENLENKDQSWNFASYHNVNNSKLRLRTKLRRNAYDQQSFARVELLDMSPTGNKQWVELYSHPVDGLSMMEVSYTNKDADEAALVMRITADEILNIALDLL